MDWLVIYLTQHRTQLDKATPLGSRTMNGMSSDSFHKMSWDRTPASWTSPIVTCMMGMFRVGGQQTVRSLVKSGPASVFGNKVWLGHMLEKAMAPHSSTLAWKILWTEEPGRLQSMRSLRVGHDWATSFSLFTFMHWRRKWQPTPVFLPEESQGWGSLVGCRLWGRTESDTTEAT